MACRGIVVAVIVALVLYADAHPAASHTVHEMSKLDKAKLAHAAKVPKVNPNDPLEANQGWILGENWKDCNTVCTNAGSSCHVEKMKAVTSANVKYVAALLGQHCDLATQGSWDNDPSIITHDDGETWCFAGYESSSCEALSSDKAYQFCCCSSKAGACPVAPPPAPVKGWVLGEPGQTCHSACALVGGVCNDASMKQVDATSIHYVASLFSRTCGTIGEYSTSEDPSISGEYCWKGTSTTTCDAEPLSIAQRFCCCSESGECPLSA